MFSCGLYGSSVGGSPAANAGVSTNSTRNGAIARSYGLVLLDKYGNIASNRTFDVFGDANPTAGGGPTQNLIAALAAIAAGRPYILATYDEPKTNADSLNSALTSLFGGTASIIGSAMPYRGAYLAMGLATQAPVIEQYCGTFVNSVSDPSAGTTQDDRGCLDGALKFTFRIVQRPIRQRQQGVCWGESRYQPEPSCRDGCFGISLGDSSSCRKSRSH